MRKAFIEAKGQIGFSSHESCWHSCYAERRSRCAVAPPVAGRRVRGAAPWGAGRREPCTPPAVYAIAGTLAAMIIDYEK